MAWDVLPWTVHHGPMLWHQLVALPGHPLKLHEAIGGSGQAALMLLVRHVNTLGVLQRELARTGSSTGIPIYTLFPWFLDLAAPSHELPVIVRTTALEAACAIAVAAPTNRRAFHANLPRFYAVLRDALVLSKASSSAHTEDADGEKGGSDEDLPADQLSCVATLLVSAAPQLFARPGLPLLRRHLLDPFSRAVETLLQHWSFDSGHALWGVLPSILRFAWNASRYSLLVPISRIVTEQLVTGRYQRSGEDHLMSRLAREILSLVTLLLIRGDGADAACGVFDELVGLLGPCESAVVDCIYALATSGRAALARRWLEALLALSECNSARAIDTAVVVLQASKQDGDPLLSKLLAKTNARSRQRILAAVHAAIVRDGSAVVRQVDCPLVSKWEAEARHCVHVAHDGCLLTLLLLPDSSVALVMRSASFRAAWIASHPRDRDCQEEESVELAQVEAVPVELREASLASEETKAAAAPSLDRATCSGLLQRDRLGDLLASYRGEPSPQVAAARAYVRPSVSRFPLVKNPTDGLADRLMLVADVLGMLFYADGVLLERTPQLMRDLHSLDALSSRRCIRAGMVYLAPSPPASGSGGSDGEDPLATSTTSTLYESFLRGMCWFEQAPEDEPLDADGDGGDGEDDPRTEHQSSASSGRYSGGLDAASLPPGAHFPYYEDATCELVVQSAPHLVRSVEKRRRHINSNHILVVFNESGRPVRPGAFKAALQVEIRVVAETPSPGGDNEPGGFACFVSNGSGSTQGAFGPLVDGIVFRSLAVLCSAVRAFIVNADAHLSSDSSLAVDPMEMRQRNIDLILQRHRALPDDRHLTLFEQLSLSSPPSPSSSLPSQQ